MNVMSIARWTKLAFVMVLVGCSGQSGDDSPSAQGQEPQAADAELQKLGVAYFDASGTVGNATFTLFDKEHSVIGGAQLRKGKESLAEVSWKGVRWVATGTDDVTSVSKDGVKVDGDAAKGYEEAENAMDLALLQANLPGAKAQAQACKKKWAKCAPAFFGGTRCCGGLHCVHESVFHKRCYPD